MNSLIFGILRVLLVLGVLWPAHAQELVLVGNIEIQPIGPRKYIPEAGFVNKLTWAGISLINPDSDSKPIPLYGYSISDLDDGSNTGSAHNYIISEILSEAASGGINLVMITPPTGDDGQYIGQVLNVPRNGQAEEGDILDAWNEFNSTYNAEGDKLLALPKPLRDDLSDKPEREWQFMAGAGLWAPIRRGGPALE